ncbi:hypothetical protein K1719_003912 [Acacia pycnantha]|nr:hypothetical protein K1719_003912 [Acacia pycnantha]
MSKRKIFKLLGFTIVPLREDQTSEDAIDQENNEENQITRRNDDDDDDQYGNHDDSNDEFVFEPQELDLTLSMSLPWRLKKKIEDMGGHDIRKIIQKTLCKSDVNANNNRFSIPESKIITDFLKPQELEVLNSSLDNKPQGIEVLVLDSKLEEFKLILKRWRMKNCFIYNLTGGWRSVVQSNNFEKGDELQLWRIRTPNRIPARAPNLEPMMDPEMIRIAQEQGTALLAFQRKGLDRSLSSAFILLTVVVEPVYRCRTLRAFEDLT